jgi:cell cycle arrest protein BUB2
MTSRHTQAQLDLAALAGSPSPRTMRSLRKIQSHQLLSSTLSSQPSSARTSAGPDELSQPTRLDSPVRLRTHRRARSNSDASTREPPAIGTQRRAGRKTGSGFGIKRSALESQLRDGPQQGNVREGLQELRYLILSMRVEADADGMVCVAMLSELE